MKRWICLTLFLCVGMAARADLTPPPEVEPPVLSTKTKDDLKVIQGDMGPLLAFHEAPDLYQTIIKVFRRAAAEQELVLAPNYVPINYVLILNSPFENAFVYQNGTAGVRIASNLIFVTTALLRKLISLKPEELARRYPDLPPEARVEKEIIDGIHRVAAILDHEEAHPLDKLTVFKEGTQVPTFSIEREYGRRASQAMELRADMDGSDLLRFADLPDHFMLNALERLLDLEKDSNILGAAVATHPENFMRLSALRIYLTLKRLQLGSNQHERPFQLEEFNREGLIRDLDKVAIGAGPLPWRKPRDLEATIDRLNRLDTVRHDLKKLELNRLMLTLDNFLQQAEADPQGLTDEVRTKVISCLSRIQGKSEYLVEKLWEKPDLLNALHPYPDSAELAGFMPRAEALRKLKFYRDPEYLATIKQNVVNYDTGNKLTNLLDYVPADILVEWFGEEFVEYRMGMILNTATGSSLDFSTYSNSVYSRLIPLYERRFGSEAKLETMTGLMLASGIQEPRGAQPFFLNGRMGNSDFRRFHENLKTMLARIRIFARGGQPEGTKLWAQVRSYTQWYWDNRAYFALQELLLNARNGDLSVDWSLIAEILELDMRQVPNQIARSIRQRLDSPEMEEWRDLIKKSRLVPVRLYRQVRSLGPVEATDRAPLPIWFTGGIANAILGKRLAEPSRIKSFTAWSVLASAVVKRDVPLREKLYRAHVDAYLTSHAELKWNELNVGEKLAQMERAFTRQWQFQVSARDSVYHVSWRQLIDAIDQSTAIEPANKELLLRYIFVRDERFSESANESINSNYFEWTRQPLPEVAREIAILIKNGVVTSVLSLVSQLRVSPYYQPIVNARGKVTSIPYYANLLSPYFELLDHLAPLMIDEVKHATDITPDWIAAYVALLNTPYRGEVKRALSNTSDIQALRDALADRAAELAPTLDSRARKILFLDLTGTGPCAGTDRFFNSFLGDEVRELIWLKGILLTERIQSHELRLRIAKKALAPRIAALRAKTERTKEELYGIITDLGLMAPQGSPGKDEFLEELALTLDLKGPLLFAFIEDQKTSNWRRVNPNLVNVASSITSAMGKLSSPRRKLFLRYLMDPRANPTGLPSEIVDELIRQTLDDLTLANQKKKDPERSDVLETRAKSIGRLVKLQTESYLRDATSTERIPLIEVTLSAGSRALLPTSGEPTEVIREFLNYEPGSIQEILLLSYLAVVKSYEAGPTLAYLLSQAAADKGSVARIFEVFGTVGIKFGQVTSIWEIFGPQVAKETRHLKDHAPPMTLFQIRQSMEKNLGKEFSDQIAVEGILGSASVKTVVRVRLPDGRPAAMYVQSDQIANQIDSSLDFGLRYLEELERRNVAGHSRILAALIEDMRSQLTEEIDFEIDAKRFAQARLVLNDYTLANAASLDGWKFDVPERLEGLPLKSKVAFYDPASGVPFDQLTPAQQTEVGPHLVRASLAMLFRYGWFDADRHKDNWLIEPLTKVIRPLDFGQLEKFDRKNAFMNDPRLVLAEFLRAFQAKDAQKVYRQASAMAGGTEKAPVLTNELKGKIDQALAQPSFPTMMRELVTTLIESGFSLDRRYSFGALKGLLVLFGEQYVDENVFMEILTEEATALFKRKIPALTWGYLSDCAATLRAR